MAPLFPEDATEDEDEPGSSWLPEGEAGIRAAMELSAEALDDR
jgi:hypothetical protein